MTDNGQRFVGANSENKKLHVMLIKPGNTLTNYLEYDEIKWKFIFIDRLSLVAYG